MWKELFAKSKIELCEKSTPHLTSNMVDILEKSIHQKLPKSYREFMLAFGPGEIAEYFRIYGPTKKKGQGDIRAFMEMNRQIVDVQIETFGDTGFIERMIPFCDTIGGDVIVWDPSKPIGCDDDYVIYMLPNDRNSIIKLATNFRDFVMKVCLSKTFGEIIGDPEFNVSKVFRSFK